MPRDIHGKPQRAASDNGGMAHMERTKAEKKERDKALSTDIQQPDYPYGLRIHLDHEGMKKVGMTDMPEVGGEVRLHAKSHVVAARSEKREGGEDERHIELQITHLGIHHAPDGFTKQDQAGSGKTPEAGHSTEKGGSKPNYNRKRN